MPAEWHMQCIRLMYGFDVFFLCVRFFINYKFMLNLNATQSFHNVKNKNKLFVWSLPHLFIFVHVTSFFLRYSCRPFLFSLFLLIQTFLFLEIFEREMLLEKSARFSLFCIDKTPMPFDRLKLKKKKNTLCFNENNCPTKHFDLKIINVSTDLWNDFFNATAWNGQIMFIMANTKQNSFPNIMKYSHSILHQLTV